MDDISLCHLRIDLPLNTAHSILNAQDRIRRHSQKRSRHRDDSLEAFATSVEVLRSEVLSASSVLLFDFVRHCDAVVLVDY